MSLADDAEAVLRVWRTSEEGALEPVEASSRGYFESNGMYVVCYSCKMGSLHVVYTWEGAQASLASRTATGLRVQSLAQDQKLEGASHQIYVQQFAEPPLLVALFQVP